MGSFPVIVPPSPGLLCALGDLVADFRNEFAQTLIRLRPRRRRSEVAAILDDLDGRARDVDGRARASPGEATAHRLRRRHALPRPGLRDPGLARPGRAAQRGLAELEERFNELHEQLYGFRMPNTASEIVNLRAVGTATVPEPSCREASRARTRPAPSSTSTRSCSRASGADAIYDRAELQPGAIVRGPGDRHRVRLHDGRPRRLRGRGRPLLQHPDHPKRGSAMSTTADELRIAEIPRPRGRPDHARHHRERAAHARFEMDAVLFRSAMCPVIREQHDEFPMLTDPQGRMVVGQFGAYINEMMADWDRGVYPGDVILTSDPYKCSRVDLAHQRLARAGADLLRGRARGLVVAVRPPDGRRRPPARARCRRARRRSSRRGSSSRR